MQYAAQPELEAGLPPEAGRRGRAGLAGQHHKDPGCACARIPFTLVYIWDWHCSTMCIQTTCTLTS